MNNLFNYSDGDLIVNFDPDTVDFIDGFINIKIGFENPCVINNIDYNGESKDIKYSMNEENFYEQLTTLNIESGDVLNIKLNTLNYESPIDIDGSISINLSVGDLESTIVLKSIFSASINTYSIIESYNTGIEFLSGGETPDFTKIKISKIGDSIFGILNDGYEDKIEAIPSSKVFSRLQSEYELNYKDNIIYSLNNIKLGDITDDIEVIVDIYNAFNYDLDIQSISEVGVYDLEYVLSSDALDFYKSVQLSLLIKKSGEIDNNGYIEFNFTDGSSSRLYLSYSRQNLFDLITNETRTVQTFTHNTDIMQMMDNSEDRVNLTDIPFYSVQVRFEVLDRGRIELENLINSTKDNKFNMPIYNESFTGYTLDGYDIIGDFRHTNIGIGDSVYVIDGSNKYTIKIIDIIGDKLILNNQITSKGYITVYPLLFTRFSKSNKSTRYNGNYTEYDLIFDVITNGKDLLNTGYDYDFKTVDGLPFYDFLLNNNDTPTEKMSDKNLDILSNGVSNDVYIYNNEKSIITEEYDLFLKDRFEICRMKKIFNDNKGMAGEFYTIKADNSFIQTQSIGSGSTVMYVENAGIQSSFLAGEFKYVIIYTAYDEEIIKEIDDIQSLSDGLIEAVYFKGEFLREYSVKEIKGIYPIVKTRFNDDELVIDYETSTIANVKIRTSTVR